MDARTAELDRLYREFGPSIWSYLRRRLADRAAAEELLQETLNETKLEHRVVCCGPEPMMEAVAKQTGTTGVPCRVSLETPMACGFGACFSCVTKVRLDDGSWDYKRVCVEGPVFRADMLVHDE